jgi:uncharacterized membrane protein
MLASKEMPLNKNRLEQLSDGVFSIVFTILILEIKVPEMKDLTNQQMVLELINRTPLFITYFLSFAVIGMFWLSHNFMFEMSAKNADRKIILMNTLYLSLISLIPFSSHFLGQHSNSPIASAFYGVNILLISFSFLLLNRYIWKTPHILHGDMTPRLKKNSEIRQHLILGFYSAGIFISFINIPVALFCYLFPVFFNIVPGLLTRTENLFGYDVK